MLLCQLNEDISLRKQFFLNLVEENYWYLLVWYVITDQGTIFSTSFEFLVYLGFFWVHVHLCAVLMIIDTYVKTQMDNEIN